MKIAFVGTHCVGKTTALYYVATQLKQSGYRAVEVISELARACPYPINEGSGFSTSLWLMFKQMETEYLMTSRSRGVEPIVLSDRSVLDQLAYATINSPERALFFAKLANEWVKVEPYDLLVYFPIKWGVIDDGVRSMSKAFQRKVDMAIYRFLGQLPKTTVVVEVSSKNRSDRCKEALCFVSDYLMCKMYKYKPNQRKRS